MTRTVHLPAGMMCQLSYNTVQLQARRLLLLRSSDWLKTSALFLQHECKLKI